MKSRTTQDCEDSVAAVDAADKAMVYANWAAMMRGDLSTELTKAGTTIKRALNPGACPRRLPLPASRRCRAEHSAGRARADGKHCRPRGCRAVSHRACSSRPALS